MSSATPTMLISGLQVPQAAYGVQRSGRNRQSSLGRAAYPPLSHSGRWQPIRKLAKPRCCPDHPVRPAPSRAEEGEEEEEEEEGEEEEEEEGMSSISNSSSSRKAGRKKFWRQNSVSRTSGGYRNSNARCCFGRPMK
ncbi:unnamed protein product [Prorocentrum cordatum]|uniref:Uncharacterized protein n=1 Tax=Prorocentrum cordatum TaxID=2364126 RepID=A0ABN9T5C5_9DINO|nr:unnamed protein product [Polarella glacialis]